MDEKSRQAARMWTLAQPAVSAFVASVIRDFRDRDDVLQETAVAVLDSFEHYDASRPFVAWAIGIAKNQVGLFLRKSRRERLVFDTETVNCLATAFSEMSPAEARQLDSLAECLSLLEGRARLLCELRYRNDQKPSAIGEALGMAANAVAKALQRIREQLRECVNRRAAMEGAG